jgi:hypothetical protein
VLSVTGQLLERSLIDCMVGYGERLCFEGAPVLEPPLAQDPRKREPEAVEGEAIDTTQLLPPLSSYENQRIQDLKAASAKLLQNDATITRKQHDKVRAKKLSLEAGFSEASALRMVEKIHRGVLLPHDELVFDDLGIVPVADVLADPERYIEETLADPLEGADYGRCKAMVMRNVEDDTLFIHSFAHGRTFYQLRHNAQSAKSAITQHAGIGTVDHAMSILAISDLEPDELVDFAATLAKASGLGIRAINARIKKEQAQWKENSRKSALASKEDGRIVLRCPAHNAELTPTATLLDQIFSADTSENPPMRDTSGHLVSVRDHEPWDLHALSADSTNGDASDNKTLKAPAEPMLVPLTTTAVEMLVEQHVRLKVVTNGGG